VSLTRPRRAPIPISTARPDAVEEAAALAADAARPGRTARLAACHRDHDPRHSDPANLLALCQRCHMLHDRAYHRARRRLRVLLRRARGDLFLGPYSLAPGWSAVLPGPPAGNTAPGPPLAVAA